MSFIKTFMNGEEGLFKSETLTPMQKLTLRFVVVGLIYFGFVVVEGLLMRLYEVKPLPFVSESQFFAILTAHPLVGIFGSTYSIVCGAFLFLVPFLNEEAIVEYQGLETGPSFLFQLEPLFSGLQVLLAIMHPYTLFTGPCQLTSRSSVSGGEHFLSWG